MENWIQSGVLLHENESYGRNIVYSPSKQFLMTCLTQRFFNLEEPMNRMLIVNLSNNKLSRKLTMKEWTHVVHWYWLSDEVFVIFNEHFTGYTTQYIYYCNFYDPISELRLLKERTYDFLRRYDEFTEDLPSIFINECKITINQHDFIFVKSSEYLLFPIDTAEFGPPLPPLKLNLRLQNTKVVGRNLWSDSELVFAYKNVVYFCVRGNNRRWHMDRFIRVPLDDFDLEEKKIIFHPEARRNNLFEPEAVTDGWFRNDFTEGLKIWQDGHIVLLYNMYPQNDRILWILNLEKETIMEKIINMPRFTYATIFLGYLQLWASIQNENDTKREMVTKFLFLNDHVPTLADICTVKLLSSRKKCEQ